MSPNRKQLLALILAFLLSISAIGQTKDYIYFGDRLLAIETVGSGCGINAAYLSPDYSLRLSCHGSPSTVYDSGGAVIAAPNAHQNAFQDVFLTSLAGSNPYTAWVITFNTATATWGPWTSSFGTFSQTPAIAAALDNATAFIVGKDNWAAYVIRRYSKTSGFTEPWVGLGGVWSSEPAVTVASNGLVYIFGVDLYGGMWYGRYDPNPRTVTWTQNGIIAGTPAVTSTPSGVYALARDGNGNVWLARVNPTNNTITWFSSGAVVNGPLSLAASNQTVWAASSMNGSVFYNSFLEASSTWSQPMWPSTGGVLSSLSVASTQGNLYLAGRDPNTLLWWYTPGGGWVQYPAQGNGPVSATPR